MDDGYDWVGGTQVLLTNEWQHIAMEPVRGAMGSPSLVKPIAFCRAALRQCIAVESCCWRVRARADGTCEYYSLP